MRAIYMNQNERYKKRWYAARGEEPPNLGYQKKEPKKSQPKSLTETVTTVLRSDEFEDNCEEDISNFTYWEGEGAGIEPIEFREIRNILQSDIVLSQTPHELIGPGELNDCFTPYENDQMSFHAFQLARKELEKRGDQLAEEVKRINDEFYRPPVKNWFCKKGAEFTKEHCRFLELKRRNANRCAFRNRANVVVSAPFKYGHFFFGQNIFY